MQILWNDSELVVALKPPGIGVQPDKTGAVSFLEMLEKQLEQPLFVVHRIDRPVQGIVLLAKTSATAHALSVQFQQQTIEKKYWAITAQCPQPEAGELTHYFEKNEPINKSRAYDIDKKGREKGCLSYRLLTHSERYFLLEIQLHTGKHHQIRAQLAAIGCPIKGDVKYGAKRGNQDRSIHLLARQLAFSHPVSGSRMEFVAPIPDNDSLWTAFNSLLGK